MGLLDTITGFVGGIVDKLFPDKNTKIKAEMQDKVLEFTREQLKVELQKFAQENAHELDMALLEDVDSARRMAMAEWEAIKGGPFINFVRAFQRPYLTFIAGTAWFSTIVFRVLTLANKIDMLIEQAATTTQIKQLMLDIPKMLFSWYDFAIVIAVIGFWFGSRHLEKLKPMKRL